MKDYKEVLKTADIKRLVDVFELTTTINSNEVYVVRGWLMDEIKSRNPEGFDKWLSLDDSEDSDLKKYVL